MQKKMFLLLMSGIFLSTPFLAHSQPTPFAILVTRDVVEGTLDKGTISVNGEILGEAFANDALKIPPGTYKAHLKYASTKFAAPGPFGIIAKTGDFIVELDPFTDGNGKTWKYILFHGGTKAEHSEGCILLGPAKHVLPDGTAMRFLTEESPLLKLRQKFYDGDETPNSTPNKDITVEVIDKIPTTLVASPTSARIAKGSSQNITITAKAYDNKPFALNDGPIAYTSANSAVATVNPTGVITGRTVGRTAVTAMYKGKKVDVNVDVYDPIAGGWSGSTNFSEVNFGGGNYCRYKVKMENLNVSLSIGNNRQFAGGSISGDMVEIPIACKFPGIPRNRHNFSCSGSINGNTVQMTCYGSGSNQPKTAATFIGQISGNTINGSVSVRRTDIGAPFNWTNSGNIVLHR